ncbi:MAG: tetratricopeptide repeat protein [Flavobacteriaceae bacterium]
MTTTDFTYLLQNPDTVTERQTSELEVVLSEFPYFQSARAIRLKGLYNQNSFRYNLELKKTAAQTTDRWVLFDFITSDAFRGIQSDFAGTKEREVYDIEVFDSEVVTINSLSVQQKREQSVMTSIKNADSQEEENGFSKTEEKRHLEQPIDFSTAETHSFQEWLQLTRFKPIKREISAPQQQKTEPIDPEKRKKTALIDKFIETNPKIIPDKNTVITNSFLDNNKRDGTMLMTETLAKVYLEQKKYQRAIEAYEILILKYPEKSRFFADRIENIKILQQNNS